MMAAMELEQARAIIAGWVAEEYGRLFLLGETVVLRRATGRVWSSALLFTASTGEHQVGAVALDEHGRIAERPTNDELLAAFVALTAARDTGHGGGGDDDFSDLGMDGELAGFAAEFDGGPRESVYDTVDHSVLEEMVQSLVATGEREKLLQAREILPQLLDRSEGRGHVLRQLGELELLLGELDLGVGYLEAAAREFHDVADLESLEHVAGLVAQVLGEERFGSSPIRGQLEIIRARLRPIDRIDQAPVFIGLGVEDLFALEGIGIEAIAPPGTEVLREGDPATFVFVVKRGVLSIRLATGANESRLVRTCFPGDLIGESSVLGGGGATCSATVLAESPCVLWQFTGAQIRELGAEYPRILGRIQSAATLHRLDSFLSTQKTTEVLDVSVRDRILGCINGVRRAAQEEVLSPSGDLPVGVYLIADGVVEYRVAGQPPRTYEADTFFGLRDTLHELTLEGEFVAATPCLLVSFDADQLRSIAADATPEVIAVLDRLD
ncbi:MAG TPA: cyclic nucleotide-binding domain-containing protein [Polyangia bacterium]|nr:cyclic nucleotide-binding domain-containing protein [Polyangia bacterium]